MRRGVLDAPADVCCIEQAHLQVRGRGLIRGVCVLWVCPRVLSLCGLVACLVAGYVRVKYELCCVSAYPSAMPRLEASVNEVSAV